VPTPLTPNAVRVLVARYLRRDARGELVETPDELFRRVARAVAKAEGHFTSGAEARRQRQQLAEEFYELLASLDFLPNSPTLMNAGTPLGQLSACFVLPVEDSMEGIFSSLKLMALIQQSGGGTGFSFSRLRPEGDMVTSTSGRASGPVSFMRIFDCATENIRQGGRRRGANMGVLRADHPDVESFIDAKLDGRSFQNFNLSVGATDEFLQAVAAGKPFELRHPRTGQVTKTLPASALWEQIAQSAWRTGDPGVVFLDTINRQQPTPQLGPIEATNPCGEVPLLPYEACNLGSLNLSRMTRAGSADRQTIDWDKLAQRTRLAVRFLDDVIEVNRVPSRQIARAVRGNRKIGLGVMGFAELLIKLEIPYDSSAAVQTADDVMQFIAKEAQAASEELASQRGVFPNWQGSRHAEAGRRLRNATTTSIAPTGTIGILAGTSPSIEPLFALAYRREHVLGDQTLSELNPLFLEHARRRGFHTPQMEHELLRQGTLADVPGVPEDARRLFQTALEVPPEQHLRIQAAFQKHVENAVSKTINLPESASAEQIADIYRHAWELGLKGVTVYRYGSKGQQVQYLGAAETPQEREHFARCDPHDCKL
jgi:ribonucleoside-diphosphate reductase alpha chain